MTSFATPTSVASVLLQRSAAERTEGGRVERAAEGTALRTRGAPRTHGLRALESIPARCDDAYARDPIAALSSHTLQVGAYQRLHVLRADGRAPTWIFLPALGLSASSYAPLLHQLRGTRAICAVDWAGFGRSRAETSMPSYSHHLCMLLHALEAIRGPLVIVAHSVSGALATEVARRRPDRVRAVVLSGYGRLDSAGHWRRQLRLGAAHPERLLFENGSRQLELLEQLRETLTTARTCPAYESFFDEAGITAARSGLRGIHVPTLLLQGERDAIIDRELLESAARDTPDARVELLPRCGHLAPIERPDGFLRAALAFTSALSSQPRPTLHRWV